MAVATLIIALFSLIATCSASNVTEEACDQGLLVSTSSGQIQGKIDPSFPHVRQFLGIPYAEPPIGNLRWSAPQTLDNPHGFVNATTFPPSCIQYFATAFADVDNQVVLQFNVQGLNSTPTDISEDCLTLSVWTPTLPPTNQTEPSLPVLIFLYGGGFGTGGTNTPYLIPTQWVDRTHDHLVISINFRGDIFGFPNAAALTEQNFGLLDQRAAVAWLQRNVARFGGDPTRMVLWGQSSGALSVDYYTYAYPNDPIVGGLIMDSGTAFTPFTTSGTDHSNFTFVAQNVGCGGFGANPAAELACMRKVNATKIENFIAGYQGYNKVPSIAFIPVVDDTVVFANYTAQALAGKQAKVPAIIGTDAQDGVIFANYDPYNASGYDPALAQLDYLYLFLCPQTQSARVRQQTGLETFVYLYSGNFTDISPKPWLGAYHGSELPLLMGTHPNYRGPSTKLEYAVSHAMQDAWVAFAADPKHGLAAQNWSQYARLGEADVRNFGSKAVAQDVSLAQMEALCDGAAPAT